MADVLITRQQIVRTGLSGPTYTAIDATDTYYVENAPGDVFLHFKNTGGSAATVTLDITRTQQGASFADPTVTIPATTGDVLVGPFPELFEVVGGTHDGRVKFTQDQATGVTVAAYRL